MSVYTYVNLDGYYNHYPIQCTGYNCPNFYDPNTGGSITPLKTIHSEGIVWWACLFSQRKPESSHISPVPYIAIMASTELAPTTMMAVD